MKEPNENTSVQPKETKKLNLMGVSDFAKYVGWTRGHVASYKKRKEDGVLRDIDFPMPDVYIGNRAYWEKTTVKKWAELNENKLKENALYWFDK